MVAALELLEAFTRRVNRVFARLASVVVLGIAAAVLTEVFFRYVLNAPTAWALDASRFALVYVTFFALAPALESGQHVVVDMFDRLLPVRLQPWQRVIGNALTLAFGAVLFWYLLVETAQVFSSGETAFAVVPMQLKYIYWIAPVGAFEFVLTAVVLLGRSWPGR